MYCVYWIKLNDHKDYLKEGYIGITNNFGRRMQEHRRKTNGILANAINKYGWENLTKQVIVSDVEQELAELIEIELRPTNKIGWNIAIGGESPLLLGESNPMKQPEQRLRASLNQLGSLNHMYGKKLTNEHKQKLKDNSSSFKGVIIGTNLETNEVLEFRGKSELIEFGFNPNCVYCCLNPRQRQNKHKGYIFERLTNE